MIIESATEQNNNALCSLSLGDDDVSCPIRFATESINRLRRNARGARVTTVLLTGRLHMTMMIGQRDILRAWCRVYRCLQQAALSKVCSTSVRAAPSREESPRGHVDRQRCVHPSERRRCDGRWECILKPANCYRFIDTNVHVYNTHARKKEGWRRMIRLPQAPVLGKPNEKVRISDYGNSSSALCHFVTLLDISCMYISTVDDESKEKVSGLIVRR